VQTLPATAVAEGHVFHAKPYFEASGYEIPQSWDELMDLSTQMVSDGFTPFCFQWEDGFASGFPALTSSRPSCSRACSTPTRSQAIRGRGSPPAALRGLDRRPRARTAVAGHARLGRWREADRRDPWSTSNGRGAQSMQKATAQRRRSPDRISDVAAEVNGARFRTDTAHSTRRRPRPVRGETTRSPEISQETGVRRFR
jgi:hypothetical protein